MPLLTVKELACERGGITLFDHLDLSVSAGELVQILGPNGSGKTTLLRVLAGLSTAYTGKLSQVQVDNFLYIGHKPGIKSMLTPLENLRWYTDRPDDVILTALARWQLMGYEHQPCYQLSAGQQQRVALARLYLTRAALWLLDEPFTAIDQAGVVQLEMLLFAHAEAGGAVVLTSHHIFRQSDRLRFLSLQQISSPQAFF
jgi:heme exporter protein A